MAYAHKNTRGQPGIAKIMTLGAPDGPARQLSPEGRPDDTATSCFPFTVYVPTPPPTGPAVLDRQTSPPAPALTAARSPHPPRTQLARPATAPPPTHPDPALHSNDRRQRREPALTWFKDMAKKKAAAATPPLGGGRTLNQNAQEKLGNVRQNLEHNRSAVIQAILHKPA